MRTPDPTRIVRMALRFSLAAAYAIFGTPSSSGTAGCDSVEKLPAVVRRLVVTVESRVQPRLGEPSLG